MSDARRPAASHVKAPTTPKPESSEKSSSASKSTTPSTKGTDHPHPIEYHACITADGLPWVKFDWGSMHGAMSPTDLHGMAAAMMREAAAAETDALLFQLLQLGSDGVPGFTVHEARKFIAAFRSLRKIHRGE